MTREFPVAQEIEKNRQQNYREDGSAKVIMGEG